MQTIPIQKQTITISTGQSTTETVNAHILPARPGACQECGSKHAPDQPHNAQSLLYQYAFYGREGRWPTWNDALAHCPDNVRELWVKALEAQGVSLEGKGGKV